MKLKEINKKEFDNFCINHPVNNFFQSKEWAELKRKEGWHTYFLGVEHNGKIKAASLVLSRELPLIKKRIFYAPRGFIVNFKDLELLRFFTKELKIFIKDKKGIFLRMDPYLSLKELDNEGKYIQGGYDNEKCIDVLKSLGYIHLDSNFTTPNTLYKLNLKDKDISEIFNNFDEHIKNTILTNEKKAISVRDANDNDMDKVFNIINKSTTKINFISNTIEDFYQIMKKEKLLDVKLIQIDIDKYLKNASNEDEVEEAKKLSYEYGHKVIIGCSISICYNNEVTTVCTAINDKFKDFLAQYNLNYEIIKWTTNKGYETYNFYGIDDNLDDNNKLYQYCKGFNGNVVKLLGEFDLVINDFFYKKYNKYLLKTNRKITEFKKKKKS